MGKSIYTRVLYPEKNFVQTSQETDTKSFMLTSNQVEQVTAMIFRVEGGTNTHHPYGIMAVYKHTSPHDACYNTVMHVSSTYHVTKIDRYFITMLAHKYCPPSVDPIGYSNWTNNAIQILHL